VSPKNQSKVGATAPLLRGRWSRFKVFFVV
jgi:hypothetical protein